MIRSFKVYVSRDKLWIALLEYGEGEVSYDSISSATDRLNIANCKEDGVRNAINAGVYANVELSDFPPDNLPGACWVQLNDEGSAIINIYPPWGIGKIVSEWDIKDELKKAGCTEYFRLDDIIHRNAEAHKTSRAPIVFKAAERRPAEVSVEISADRKTAYLTYKRPWGLEQPTPEEVLKKIAEAGITYGIDEERVRQIVSSNSDVSKQRIAVGKDPIKGEDAKLEYLFDALHKAAGPGMREDGTADFRDLHLFENVDKGTPLVQKIPATRGEDGIDVTGKPLKAESGRDVPLPKGKGTTVPDNNQNVLVAEVAGAPKLVRGRVDVNEVLIVEDVDFSTGNIDFHGNVLVKGIVNTGFTIIASGDITCQDTVEGAHLEAGGNIFLKHGIKGVGKSVIKAGGNVMARFIERCIVSAGASVIVDEALIHSDTSAFDTVEVTNSKGSIFGGHVRAGSLVRASFIGSEMAISTEIEVGVTPHVREQIVTLNEEFRKKKNDYERASKNLVILSSKREKAQLPPEREEMYHDLNAVTTQLKDDIEEISSAIAALEEDLKQCSEGRVEARTVMHPGVTVTIKNVRRRFMEPVNKAVIMKDGPEIVVSEEVAK